MRPATGGVVQRPDLGIAVMEYYKDITQAGFIGLELMPLYPTSKQSATFTVIPASELLNVVDVSRAPRGKYNRGDWNYEVGKYSTQEKGVEEPIDDTERSLLEGTNPGLADFVATNRAMGHIIRAQEVRIAAKVFNSSRFTAHATSKKWSLVAESTPLDDINAGVEAFRAQCGMLPDGLVVSWQTYRKLRQTKQIQELLKYTFPGMDINRISAEQLAQIFDLPRLYVGNAVKNSANQAKTASIIDIWSSNYAALIKVASDNSDLQSAGFGRTFLWTDDSPSNPIVESYREEQTRSDVFRVRHHVDETYMCSYNDNGTVRSDIAAKCIYLLNINP